MKNGLYHREVYWEKEIQKQIAAALNSGLPLKFDDHAIDKKYERKISINGITKEKLKNGYCFEAEVKNNKVVKFAIRYGYNDTDDLASVWNPKSDCLYCKTIWINKKNDKHITLDESKYVSYPNKDMQHISISLGDVINEQNNNNK